MRLLFVTLAFLGVSGSISGMADENHTELLRQAESVAAKYRSESGDADAKSDLKLKVKSLIGKSFEARQTSQREQLNLMQEKLRKAEVEISMERAKLARERAVLDERLNEAQEHDDNAQLVDDAKGGDKHGRGKWLTRLGLREEE